MRHDAEAAVAWSSLQEVARVPRVPKLPPTAAYQQPQETDRCEFATAIPQHLDHRCVRQAVRGEVDGAKDQVEAATLHPHSVNHQVLLQDQSLQCARFSMRRESVQVPCRPARQDARRPLEWRDEREDVDRSEACCDE